jgi:hypothetical protein
VHVNRTAPQRLWLIVPAAARIRRVFEMTRLDEVLALLQSREEARDRLSASA